MCVKSFKHTNTDTHTHSRLAYVVLDVPWDDTAILFLVLLRVALFLLYSVK